MKVVRTQGRAARRRSRRPRRAGRTIGLVPTMGALHEGHLSLLRAARERCDVVVMSLFVNPAQFGPGEDLDAYPRDEARDARARRGRGRRPRLRARASTRSTRRASRPRSRSAAGSPRSSTAIPARRGPEHFRGVTTVVAKLFNAVQPDVAFFGQKDAQQAVVIRRMAADLDFPVEIEVLPTVREPDGLALSSRNAYLERRRARAGRGAQPRAARRPSRRPPRASARPPPALDAARGGARRGRDRARVPRGARRRGPRRRPQSFNGRPVLVAVAARVGGARLIDNVVIERRRRADAATDAEVEDPPGDGHRLRRRLRRQHHASTPS